MCNIANNSDKTIIISDRVNFIDISVGIIDISNENRYPLKIISSHIATKIENIEINIIGILLKFKYLSYFSILIRVDFSFIAIFISKSIKKNSNIMTMNIETFSYLKIKRLFSKEKKLFLKMNIGIVKMRVATI